MLGAILSTGRYGESIDAGGLTPSHQPITMKRTIHVALAALMLLSVIAGAGTATAAPTNHQHNDVNSDSTHVKNTFIVGNDVISVDKNAVDDAAARSIPGAASSDG